MEEFAQGKDLVKPVLRLQMIGEELNVYTSQASSVTDSLQGVAICR